MDQLKQNGFMIVVGVLVAMAAGLTGFRLFGIGGDIDEANTALDEARGKMQMNIIDQGESAPNRTWPDVYTNRATSVKRVLALCYKEYGDTDDRLEMWMDENLKPKASEKPPGGDGPWKARYNDRGNALRKTLDDKGIKVGVETKAAAGPLGGGPGRPPSKEEEGGLGFVDSPDMKDKDPKVYQKQWWVQERFVQAVLATPNVVRVERVEFAAEAGPTDTAPPAPSADGTMPTTYHKPAVIKVKFTLQVMFGDVPKFVTNLIKLDNDLPIRFRNVDMRVVKLAMMEQKSTDVEEIVEDVPGEGFDPAKWKPSKDVTPMPVRVEVSAEVLDFDIPKNVRQ